MVRIYYAHPLQHYNSEMEQEDHEQLYNHGVVECPNQRHHQIGYERLGMDYFKSVVASCDILAFRAMEDGMIGSGVALEINYAQRMNIPVWEISGKDNFIDMKPKTNGRILSRDETNERIKNGVI